VAKHLRIAVDDVAVAASHALALDESGVDQVGQDPLRRADGDPDGVRDVTETDVRVAGDAEQDLRVVGDELPPAPGRFG
jgi:hypothetical protein